MLAQRLVLRIEVPGHAPEVPGRGLGFRCDEVDDGAGRFDLGVCIEAALARVRHTYIDQHVAWRIEAADLPPVHWNIVGQVVSAQACAPERRRHDAFHVALGDGAVSIHPRFGRRLIDLLLTDGVRVQVSLVGQVHEVVDHEPVIAFDVVQPTAVGPLGVIGPGQMVDLGGVGLLRIARPDPDKTVALHHGIRPYGGEATHALAWHGYRLAIATHLQTVVATNQFAVFDLAQRQRSTAVGAKVFDGGHLVLGATEEHDGLATNLAAEGLSIDFAGHSAHVPSVLGKHNRSLLLALKIRAGLWA